jgi:outer membrane protein OmpA-like peptidoglycan-associated protein
MDIVGDAVEPAGLWYSDDQDVFLRMAVGGDPMSGVLLKAQTWAWLVDVDGDDAFDVALASEGASAEFAAYTMDGTTGLQPGFAAYGFVDIWGNLADDHVRTALGPTNTWYVDVRAPRVELAADVGIGDQDPLRIALAVGPSLFFNWADSNNCMGPCVDFGSAASDPVTIDIDLDGWTDTFEAYIGTDPLDADSDDDGLLDGEERDGDADGDGLHDALDCDADADGLLDGTEGGVTVPHPDTDLYANCFIADADTVAANTDPYNQDTDAGTLVDGLEDWNFNGRMDLPWETDPNDATDDVDSDGDGIADVLELLGTDGEVNDLDSDGDGLLDVDEWLYDTDGDGLPNFLDPDSDGDGLDDVLESASDTDGDGVPDYLDTDSDDDGIEDGIEGIDDADGDGLGNNVDTDSDGDGIEDGADGAHDTDQDGTPNFLDDDSDGDGIPDSVEGGGDADGDGIPNHEDEDADGDGIPDDVETGDDADEDGIPNNLDEDSDGDGIGDEDEGTGDGDCDGVPDFLDDDNEDDFCDSGQPIPGTLPGDNLNPESVNPLTGSGHFTGGACNQTGPAGALWLPTLLMGLATLTRRRRSALVAAVAALPSAAGAQEVNAQRMQPNMDLSPLVHTADGDTGEAFSGHLGLWVNYADDPLVFRSATGEQQPILGSVATSSLVGSFGLGAVRVGADLPVHLYTSGFGIEQATQLGDLRLGSEAELLELDTLRIGAFLDLNLPTGGQDAWVGAGEVSVHAGGIAALQAGSLTAALNLGAKNGTGSALGDLTVSSALTSALGASYALSDSLSTSIELDREDWFNNAGESGAHPTEWLASAHVAAGDVGQLSLGGGSGLSQGVGAPDFRVIAGFRASLGGQRSTSASTAAAASGNDSPVVIINVDEPDTPEMGNLVVRVIGPAGNPIRGAKVRVIGTLGQPIKVGADGILEAALPAGAHEVSVSAPGWDATSTAVALGGGETRDVTVLLRPMQDVVVDVETGRIYLRRKVFFEVDRNELKPESLTVLDQLVETLLGHPEIATMKVEGHTDVTGSDSHNLALSQARAEAVVAYLIRQGVPATRLQAQGMGEARPLQPGDSDAVHATNRRVEFHITEMAEQ